MNILVTGGSGFIGRNIVKLLKEEGNTVATLDIKDKNSIADYHIMSDLRNLHMVQDACKGMDYVFHLAAVTSPPEFENPLGEGYSVNVLGTYNVLAASAVNGVKRVILASSSSVYGSTSKPSREDSSSDSFSNLYPLSKKINEITTYFFFNHNLETVSLRYFNTYGIGENSKGAYSSVIWKFIESIKSEKQPEIYGDGRQSRDFIYVKDTATASVLAMKKGKPGETYNVGTGITTDFNEIFNIVKTVTGFKGEARHVPNPLKSYQNFTQADLSKARDELGFLPEYDIAKGVTEILESFSGKN
jgi:UDP-glucose 4-epimerase